ncbi:MAG TPA: DUF4199 domain-containing protein [Saprospiraceae bacterium]|nr:DUF4199 domain-containing protein [Saprospiraceae bacterium]HMQ83013.1 DUF4199 domain-containing protein [Saprospiraceae bacterium]
MFKRIAVRYGLLAGISTVGLFLLLYFVEPAWMFNPWIYWGSLIIYLVFMWQAVQADRKNKAGNYTFQNALQTAFLVFVVANLIYYLFYWLLYAWIDPGLVDLQRDMMRAAMEKNRDLMDDKQRQELLKSLGDAAAFKVTFSTTILAYARSLIGGFILALAMSPLVKD